MFERVPFALSIAFRGRLQWPFRPGDTLRVYRDGDRELLAELPASLVIELIGHHLHAVSLQRRVTDHVKVAQPTPVLIDPPEPTQADLPLSNTETPRLRAATGRRLRGR
jgi:hypothetical protein